MNRDLTDDRPGRGASLRGLRRRGWTSAICGRTGEWSVNGTLTGEYGSWEYRSHPPDATVQAPVTGSVQTPVMWGSIPPGPAFRDGGEIWNCGEPPGITGSAASPPRLRAPGSKPTTWASRPGWTPGISAAPSSTSDQVPDERTRFYQIDFVPSLEWNFDGDLVGVDAFLGSVQQWSNFWMSSTALGYHPETDNDRLTRGGPLARSPDGFNISQWISTDQRKPYNLSLNASYAVNGRGGLGFLPQLRPHRTPLFRPGDQPQPQLSAEVSPWLSMSGAVSDDTAVRNFRQPVRLQ